MSSTARRLSSFAAAIVTLALVAGVPARAAHQTRLKDILALQGYNAAPLVGYGLVVGLNKTGDKRQTIFSMQSRKSRSSPCSTFV